MVVVPRSHLVLATERVPALVPTGRHDALPPFYLHRLVTLIGSRQRADIRLESDEVSRSHAIVVNVGGRVVIRDLASRTRLYVNGREIREAVLQDGDHVTIGRFALRFAAGDAMHSGQSADATRASAVALLTADGLDPSGVGLDGRLCVIGTRNGVDLVLHGKDVSFAHAVIVRDGDRHIVRDLGSRNGTFVDGIQVEGDAELRPGVVVRIGAYRIRYSPVASIEPTVTGTVAQRGVGTESHRELSAPDETWLPPADRRAENPELPSSLSIAELQSPPFHQPGVEPGTNAQPKVAFQSQQPPAKPGVHGPALNPAPAVHRPWRNGLAANGPVKAGFAQSCGIAVEAVPPTMAPGSPAMDGAPHPVRPAPAPDQGVDTPQSAHDATQQVVALALNAGVAATCTPDLDFASGLVVSATTIAPFATRLEYTPLAFAPDTRAPLEATPNRSGPSDSEVFELASLPFPLAASNPQLLASAELATQVPVSMQAPSPGAQPLHHQPVVPASPADATAHSPATLGSCVIPSTPAHRDQPARVDAISAIPDAFVAAAVAAVETIAMEPSGPSNDASDTEQEIPPVRSVEPALAPDTQRHTWSSRTDQAPPQTWGVLAAAVALSEQPQRGEPVIPLPDSSPVPPRRSGLKWAIVFLLIVSAAGVAYVFLKTNAYAAVRRVF